MAFIKERNSNLELYRILVMFSIVVHHYVVNSELFPIMCSDPFNPQSLFLYIWGMWGKTGINCFVLITGYFMCKSEITLKKFLKLLLEVEFYEILIYLCFALFGGNGFSLKDFIWYSLPFRTINTWSFTDGYLLFFFFIPFLNILINGMDKKRHGILLVLCLAIFSVIAKIPQIPVNLNYIFWFCIIYLIGAYFKCYPFHEGDVKFWRRSSLISLLVSILSVLVSLTLVYFLKIECRRGVVYYFVEDSNALLAVATSVCVFVLFNSIKVKQSKFINSVAAGTFGVLLIHDNLQIRPWLWNDILDNAQYFNSNLLYIHAIFVPIVVFVICSLIEYLRRSYLESPILDLFYGKVQRILINRK